MSPLAAMVALGGVTVLTAFNADYLVGAIDEVAQQYHIPKAFIGTILLPIVGNMAEHLTAVWMASKGKMEISLGIAIGSSTRSCGDDPDSCAGRLGGEAATDAVL